MTGCAPHEHAGPQACPYCELERRTAWSNEQIAKRDKELEQLEVQLANLKLRLDMVTADPESLASRLLSKHNALRMASANMDAGIVLMRRIEDAVAVDPDTAPESLVRSIVRVIKTELQR